MQQTMVCVSASKKEQSTFWQHESANTGMKICVSFHARLHAELRAWEGVMKSETMVDSGLCVT